MALALIMTPPFDTPNGSNASNTTRDAARVSAMRIAFVLLLLSAAILAPFALWGQRMDEGVPAWFAAHSDPLIIAIAGIVLLVADVLLPIPSSIVSIGLCVALGPWWGGLATFVGSTLSFLAGYLLGRLTPEARLRAWIGGAAWDRLRHRAQAQALWWIVVARPLPMLAEMTAILAGVWRVPFALALALAALSSAAVAAIYAVCVAWGLGEPGVLPLLAVCLLLPSLLWFIQRRLTQPTNLAKEPQ